MYVIFLSPTMFRPCTKDNLATGSRQSDPSLETSYPNEEWCSDLAGQSAWPVQDRAGQAKAQMWSVDVSVFVEKSPPLAI